jgi:hypothetical protein
MDFRRLQLLLILAAACAIPGYCDFITASGGGGVSVGATGTLTFTDTFGSNSSNFTGNSSAVGGFEFFVGPLALPGGAILKSAVLDFSLTPSGALTPSLSRSEADYTYQSGEYWVCTDYYWGRCYSGYWVPTYSTGYGGTANISASSKNRFTWLSDGTTSVLLPSSGGSVDLLSLGFGPSLLAGKSFAIRGQGEVDLISSISSYGYEARTSYNISAFENVSANGTVTAGYSLPSPVPEPGSIPVLATLLAGIGIASRKRLTR